MATPKRWYHFSILYLLVATAVAMMIVDPSDDTTVNCIDYLSDTGWKVPPLPLNATAHELVLQFEKPISLRADQRLTFTVDSGSAKELAVLNCIRVSFRQRTVGEAMKPSKSTRSEVLTDDDVTTKQDNDSPGSDRSETGMVVLLAIDADTGIFTSEPRTASS